LSFGCGDRSPRLLKLKYTLVFKVVIPGLEEEKINLLIKKEKQKEKKKI